MKKIMIVLSKKSQCGVYEFGQNIFKALVHSKKYDFVVAECGSLEEYELQKQKYQPAIIIFNYYPYRLPWGTTRIAPRFYRNNVYNKNEIHVGIIHESSQLAADTAIKPAGKYFFNRKKILHNVLFDYYIAPDPTLLLKNPIVFKTGRLVPEYDNINALPDIPVIGSFGLATNNKGFELLIKKIQEEFDKAIIRINMPLADAVANSDKYANELSAKCYAALYKKDVKLEITHDFLSAEELLNFIAKNSMNVFLYQDYSERGLSSTIDYALAVQRPIAVSKSRMFRHIQDITLSICIEDRPLKQIMNEGFEPLEEYRKEWSSENLAWEYERILDSIFKEESEKKFIRKKFTRAIKSKVRRLVSLPDRSVSWLRNTNRATEDSMEVSFSASYKEVNLSSEDHFNRILDDKARMLYKPAVDKLFELVPKTMTKKIPEANVQQGFVFDTVYRNIKKYQSPKILCVGSYEDTASMSLKKMGYSIEEIDPVLNYFLQEFFTKPSTKKNSYDIIFSTSVIEHDPDDENFIKCISELLAPGGIAILTCDYNDQWIKGDPKPDVDVRLYTQSDIKKRLLPIMKNCFTIDEPNWECKNPDFNYMGNYQYTFASIVVKKNN